MKLVYIYLLLGFSLPAWSSYRFHVIHPNRTIQVEDGVKLFHESPDLAVAIAHFTEYSSGSSTEFTEADIRTLLRAQFPFHGRAPSGRFVYLRLYSEQKYELVRLIIEGTAEYRSEISDDFIWSIVAEDLSQDVIQRFPELFLERIFWEDFAQRIRKLQTAGPTTSDRWAAGAQALEVGQKSDVEGYFRRKIERMSHRLTELQQLVTTLTESRTQNGCSSSFKD